MRPGDQTDDNPAASRLAEAADLLSDEGGPVEKAAQPDADGAAQAETLKALRERLAELEARIGALSGQLSESRGEANRVEEELKAARALAETRAAEQQKVAELEAARAADRVRVAELEQRLAELRAELASSRKQSTAIEEALTATQREAGSVESEQENLRKLLQAQGLQIASERRRVEELEGRLSGLVAELSKSREDIGRYRSQIESYQADISRYRDELRGNSEELLRNREALDAAQDRPAGFLSSLLGSLSGGQAAMIGAALVLLLLSITAIALLVRRSARGETGERDAEAAEEASERKPAPAAATPEPTAAPAPQAPSRRAESESLAVRKDAPRGRLLALAMDEIEVAIPILVKSANLTDNDLISIIKQKTSQHRLAIAMRRRLSAPVIEALIETGEPKIVAAVLDNDRIELEKGAQDKLLLQAQRLPALKAAILKHPGVPMALAARLQGPPAEPDAAAATIPVSPEPPAEVAAAPETVLEVEEPPLWEPLPEVPRIAAEPPAPVLPATRAEDVEAPIEEGVAPHALIEALRKGKMELFEALFSRMTGLRPPRLQQVIYGRGGEELATACRAHGLGKPLMTSIFIWSRKGRADLGPVDPRELSNAMTVYDQTSPEAARQLVAAWTQEHSFPAALDPAARDRMHHGPAAE